MTICSVYVFFYSFITLKRQGVSQQPASRIIKKCKDINVCCSFNVCTLYVRVALLWRATVSFLYSAPNIFVMMPSLDDLRNEVILSISSPLGICWSICAQMLTRAS